MNRATLANGGPQPLHGLLWLLSLVWHAGGALDQRSKRRRASRLPVPVVSVGNITTGGTGKTPVTIELLREFRGWKPGLLTRGHGRIARQNVLLLDPNQDIDAGRSRATKPSFACARRAFP